MYDVAIIGAGPAGVSAALNLHLHNKNLVWFGTETLSPKLQKAEKIANYPGIPMISGEELNRRFSQQIEEAGLKLTGQLVSSITSSKQGFMVLGGNDVYEAKTVLLTTGSVNAKGFDGEDKLLGHGVSYCATCDGFFYKNKTIAVFCADKHYENEVKSLSEIAAKIYLFTSYEDSDINLPNVEHQKNTIKTIDGEERVSGVTLSDGSSLTLDGVFVLRSAIAPAKLLSGLNTDGANIVVDRGMETSIKGCFAAGDCTGSPYQIAKAVGEGNIAAHSILQYLHETEKQLVGSRK